MSNDQIPNDTMFGYNEEVVLVGNNFSGYSHIAHKNKKVTASDNIFSKEKIIHITVNDTAGLSKYLASIGVTPKDITELEKSIKEDGNVTEKLGPKVADWLSKMGLKSLKGGLKVGTQVVTPLLTQALMKYYGLDK